MIHTLMALDKVKCTRTPSPRGPLSRFFGLLRGQNAPKWAQNGLISPFCAPQMVYDEVWKNVFLTHFLPIFGPKTAHFQGILGFLEDPNGPPQAQNSPKTLVLASHMV